MMIKRHFDLYFIFLLFCCIYHSDVHNLNHKTAQELLYVTGTSAQHYGMSELFTVVSKCSPTIHYFIVSAASAQICNCRTLEAYFMQKMTGI